MFSTAFLYLHQNLWGYDGEVSSALGHSFRALSFRSFEVNGSVSLPFQVLFSGSNFKTALGYCKTLRNTCTEEASLCILNGVRPIHSITFCPE